MDSLSQDQSANAGAARRPSDVCDQQLSVSGAVSRPRFIAHQGDVWRKSEHGWHSMMPVTCERLLEGFRSDAANKTDWFRKDAARLADELETCINLASAQRKERTAA